MSTNLIGTFVVTHQSRTGYKDTTKQFPAHHFTVRKIIHKRKISNGRGRGKYPRPLHIFTRVDVLAISPQGQIEQCEEKLRAEKPKS